jgi:integrase
LDADPPHIHLEANATKNGKEAHQPIPAATAEELRGYLTGKEGVLWPIAGKKTARMLRMDLVEAGVPVEVAGRVADFHALRTTFGTNCALKKVPLALAMTLMRHSTPVLTAKVYTVAQLSDLSKEVEKLG